MADRLSAGTVSSEEDPLLQLAGVLHSELTDLAERHDDYIGPALAEDLKRDAGK